MAKIAAAPTASGILRTCWDLRIVMISLPANLRLSLRRVVGLLTQVGDHYAAAVLHGALDASGAMPALPFKRRDAEDLDVAVAVFSDALGQARFDAAVEEGASLSETALVTFVQERIAAFQEP